MMQDIKVKSPDSLKGIGGIVMKKLTFVSIAIVCIFLLGYNSYKSVSAGSIKDKLVRFHVIANSDSEEDQRVKLKVRDAVLKKVGAGLEDKKSQEESLIYLNGKLDEIEKIANDILRKEGKTYRAKAMIGDYNFPVKNYNSVTLPAGEYKALRIVLGDGDGKNWWCVMFPPLCFIDITRGYTEERTDTELKKVLTKNEVESISTFKGQENAKEGASAKASNEGKPGNNQPVNNSSSVLKQEETKVEFRFKSLEWIKSAFDSVKSWF